MTLQANTDSVSNQNDDPSGVVNPKIDQAPLVENEETVSYHTHKKLLAQRKTDQLRAQEMQDKIVAYEKREAEAAEAKLVETNSFKELADTRQARIDELESRDKEREKALMDGAKLNAFKELLPGTVKNSNYYAFVNLDAIELDPNTGTVDQTSVEKQVNEFVTHHTGLYTPKSGARLPGDAPSASAPTSYSEELKLCKTQKQLDSCRKKWGRD